MIAVPLGVDAGLKVPQLPEGLQLHVTPEFLTSFVTVAVKFALPDTATVCVAGDTLTAIGRIETFALAESAVLVTEVAVIVTVPPVGLFSGAV